MGRGSSRKGSRIALILAVALFSLATLTSCEQVSPCERQAYSEYIEALRALEDQSDKEAASRASTLTTDFTSKVTKCKKTVQTIVSSSKPVNSLKKLLPISIYDNSNSKPYQVATE